MHVNPPQAPHIEFADSPRRYKCWKVTGILPWAALLFVAGYILREIGAFHYDNLKIFISSLVLIYASPFVPPRSPTGPWLMLLQPSVRA